jgi:hypothetical protein
MPSTIKTLEQTTYDTVRSSSFTKIHGRPTQSNYKNLNKEASDLASKLDDITYDWSQSPTGDKYGLLAEIISEDEYYHLTNLTWTQEVEPATYDPAINDTTATYTWKQMDQEWERTRKTWAIRKGFLQGIAANFRDALNESWYSQLKSVHTAYRNTTPIQIFGTPELTMVSTRCPRKEESTHCLLCGVGWRAAFHSFWQAPRQQPSAHRTVWHYNL